MENPSQVKLDRPGAGLPFFEKLVARYWVVPRLSRSTPWEESVRRFRKEGERILETAGPLSDEALDERVLIERIQGIEDSSRYWSISMTMDHLMIVGRQIAQVIVALGAGQVPSGEADIAKVKPPATRHGKAILTEFRKFIDETEKMLATQVKDRESKTTFPHPWFGGMAAYRWHWLLGSHQHIHRRQVQHIAKGLSK